MRADTIASAFDRLESRVSKAEKGVGLGQSYPFYLAAKGVDVALMRTLLAHGADPMAPNRAGTTPLMAAAGIELHYLGEDDGTP